MKPPAARQAVILLVEDNDDDVFLMRRALKAAQVAVSLQVTGDGQEALDYLAGAGQYSNRSGFPLPALILLDLKLPYVHGFEVLNWIRQQAALKEINVVVLTSSPEERDLQKARELGARGYLVKPPTAEMLLGVLKPLTEGEPIPPLSAPAPSPAPPAL